MRMVELKDTDEVVDLIAESWTEEGAIAIYPYEENIVVTLTKKDLKDNDIINFIYSNEDVSLFEVESFENVVGYQNVMRDFFRQEMLSIDASNNVERYNTYKSIVSLLGGN